MSHQILLGGFLQPDPNGNPTEVYTFCLDGQIEPARSREFIVHVRLSDRVGVLRLTLERARSGWQCRVTLPEGAQVQIDKADPPETPEKKLFERPTVTRMPPGWTPADHPAAKAPIDPALDFILNGPGGGSPGETLESAKLKLDEMLGIPPGETVESAMLKLDKMLGGDLFKDTLRKP